ncbi:MAG: hypothetical protein LBM73_01010 [Candidatus Nomurabacteria bacterium]|jgi:hypothetical protein|nr:hypothetical protein [Candidatus Nomurabacteria bacterium]
MNADRGFEPHELQIRAEIPSELTPDWVDRMIKESDVKQASGTVKSINDKDPSTVYTAADALTVDGVLRIVVPAPETGYRDDRISFTEIVEVQTDEGIVVAGQWDRPLGYNFDQDETTTIGYIPELYLLRLSGLYTPAQTALFTRVAGRKAIYQEYSNMLRGMYSC